MINRLNSNDIFQVIEAGDLMALKVFIQDNESLFGAKNLYGYTLLHMAAYHARLNIIEFLLAKGASLSVQCAMGIPHCT